MCGKTIFCGRKLIYKNRKFQITNKPLSHFKLSIIHCSHKIGVSKWNHQKHYDALTEIIIQPQFFFAFSQKVPFWKSLRANRSLFTHIFKISNKNKRFLLDKHLQRKNIGDLWYKLAKNNIFSIQTMYKSIFKSIIQAQNFANWRFKASRIRNRRLIISPCHTWKSTDTFSGIFFFVYYFFHIWPL